MVVSPALIPTDSYGHPPVSCSQPMCVDFLQCISQQGDALRRVGDTTHTTSPTRYHRHYWASTPGQGCHQFIKPAPPTCPRSQPRHETKGEQVGWVAWHPKSRYPRGGPLAGRYVCFPLSPEVGLCQYPTLCSITLARTQVKVSPIQPVCGRVHVPLRPAYVQSAARIP